MSPRATEKSVPSWRKRVTDLRELERANDTPTVVRMDPRRRSRVELAESCVRRVLPVVVVELSPTLTRAGLGRGRQLELGEGCAEVQPRPSHYERCGAGGEDLVDRCVRERCVFADGRSMRERPDPYEPLRMW